MVIALTTIICTTSLHALQLLEPVSTDLTGVSSIDVGYAAPGESILISFLLNPEDKFDLITVSEDNIADVIVENTKRTPESIYTTIKLNSDVDGLYKLKLVLVGESRREITLSMYVTNDVIATILLPYEEKANYDSAKKIKFNIINKAISTKKIKITSDLPVYWFDKYNPSKNELIQPNSIKEITYVVWPKTVGNKEFNIKIYTNYNSENIFNTIPLIAEDEAMTNYHIKINVIKNLSGIYGSFDHSLPLFGANTFPIYFFNKLIN